jgi:hypothetical protein
MAMPTVPPAAVAISVRMASGLNFISARMRAPWRSSMAASGRVAARIHNSGGSFGCSSACASGAAPMTVMPASASAKTITTQNAES